MIDYECIIFTDNVGENDNNYRGKAIGPYRLRTEAAHYGYNVRVVDFFVAYNIKEIENILDKLVSDKTVSIGFSFCYFGWKKKGIREKVQFIVDYAKSRNIKIILGGSNVYSKHLTFKYDGEYFTIDDVDYVISGFSEKAFIHVLDHISGKCKIYADPYDGYEGKYFINGTNRGFDVNNLRTVWLPEDIIDPWDGLPIEISRGCIFNCAFCNFALRGKKKFDYFRREEEIKEELKYNYETFGVQTYMFVDDTYNDSREKIDMVSKVLSELDFKIKFSAYIKPELLVAFPEHQEILPQQGLRSTGLGIESFNFESRKAFRKGYSIEKILDAVESMWLKSGKKTTNSFLMILGAPHETIDQMKKSYDHIKKAEYIHNATFNPLYITSKDIHRTDPTAPKIDFISEDPSSFGYKCSETNDNSFNGAETMLNWENEHTNYQECFNLAAEMRKDLSTWNLPASNAIYPLMSSIMGKHTNEFIDGQYKMTDQKLFIKRSSAVFMDKKRRHYDSIMNDVRTPINVKRYIEPQPIKLAI